MALLAACMPCAHSVLWHCAVQLNDQSLPGLYKFISHDPVIHDLVCSAYIADALHAIVSAILTHKAWKHMDGNMI